MIFWDSSALVPVLVSEPRSAQMLSLLGSKPAVIWWGTPVECRSAICRRHRQGVLSAAAFDDALRRLEAVVASVQGIAPTEEVRRRTNRLLATHALRAADALQLSAALAWCEDQPHQADLACLDERLREAAGKEGFTLLP